MFLGRRIGHTNGTLLLTYRDGEVDIDHPLRRVLGDLPPAAVERIQLGPLSVAAVAELAGDKVDDVDAFMALTGGNPLFVSEVLAAGDATVPTSVRDAVWARLARLSAPARDLVENVSIVPGRAEWPLIEQLVGPDRQQTQEGVRQGLLDVGDGGVAFRHELQRRAVEASLTADALRRRHRLVLAALGEAADPARLVHHAQAAQDTDALLVHAVRAGRAAMDARSHRQALAHFRTVGAHLDQLPTDDAADVTEEWARAAVHLDTAEACRLVLRTATLRRETGDPLALARTLALGVFVLGLSGRAAQARTWAAEAVALADGQQAGPQLAYALTEQARLHLLHDDGDAGMTAARRAIAVAEEIDDDRTLASAMILDGVFRHGMGDRHGLAVIGRAHQHAENGGHRFEQADALLMRGICHAARYDDLPAAVRGPCTGPHGRDGPRVRRPGTVRPVSPDVPPPSGARGGCPITRPSP
jgi:hypothetical protein